MTAPIRPEHEPDERGPYRVEVESERTETVRSYGIVVDADGTLNGQFFDDEDDANDLADTMNYAWLAGRDAARKEQASNLAALADDYAAAVRALRRNLNLGRDWSPEMIANMRNIIESDIVPLPDADAKADALEGLRVLSTPRARAVLEQGETT